MRYPTGSVRGSWQSGCSRVRRRHSGARAERQAPKILIDSVAGRDSFDLYCSPCHGKDGPG